MEVELPPVENLFVVENDSNLDDLLTRLAHACNEDGGIVLVMDPHVIYSRKKSDENDFPRNYGFRRD